MAKNLLIVESPAKAKTIEGYLGKDFTVKSSYGHIRDLVKSEDAIDIANNFEQKYEVPADIRRLRPDLPPGLTRLIQQLLAHEPEGRPSARTLLRELVKLEIATLQRKAA